MIDWVAVSRHIRAASCMCFEASEIHRAARCSVNHEHVTTDSKRRFFIKTNRADRYNMFENEARSLSALAAGFRWV